MSAGRTPNAGRAALSVVIVTPAGPDDLARTMECLRAQTARERMEVVVVGPEVAAVRTGQAPFEVFAAARGVTLRRLSSTGGALAAGMRAARAPIVVCAEEHSYPDPGWAAALIEAHRGPWAAVGGVLENANPRTSISWAALFSDFGSAVAPVAAGESLELPGHHTSYKRAALADYGGRLERCLEVEWVLQEDLRLRGGRLYREPRAVSAHVNVSALRAHLSSELNGGRSFAANRAWLRRWSRRRRLVYAAAAPLVVVMRLGQSLRQVRRARPELVPRILPALVMTLATSSLGQAIGYAIGPGGASERRMSVELRRRSHLGRRDRRALARTPPASRDMVAASTREGDP